MEGIVGEIAIVPAATGRDRENPILMDRPAYPRSTAPHRRSGLLIQAYACHTTLSQSPSHKVPPSDCGFVLRHFSILRSCLQYPPWLCGYPPHHDFLKTAWIYTGDPYVHEARLRHCSRRWTIREPFGYGHLLPTVIGYEPKRGTSQLVSQDFLPDCVAALLTYQSQHVLCWLIKATKAGLLYESFTSLSCDSCEWCEGTLYQHAGLLHRMSYYA